jgi:serine/threonine protein kinase
MTSSSTLRRLNADLSEKNDLLHLVRSDELGNELKKFDYSWASNKFEAGSTLADLFESYGWTKGDCSLSRIGQLVYGRIAVHFTDLTAVGATVGSYTIEEKIRSGKNSVVFTARHRVLGREVVLKIIRPGASDNIEESFRKLSRANIPGNVVLPSDIFPVETTDVMGEKLTVNCLVFPKIIGPTFAKFLRQDSLKLNPLVVRSFIGQIGGALAAIESAGAYHGDLHDRNIIVSKSANGAIIFNLIDISFDAVGSLDLETAQNNDLENLATLVWRLLSEQRKSNPRVSFRKFVGSEIFFPVEKLLTNGVTSVNELMSAFRSRSVYESYINDKDAFLSARFKAPDTFRLQRYEELTDPTKAVELFEPLPELMSKLTDFGNIYVSGNRGCGKSTYLAMLGFFPSVDSPVVDPRDIFGIYFPCRQGDFRTLSVHEVGKVVPSSDYYRHILILKTIRRTLEIISKAISRKKLNEPKFCEFLRNALNRVLPAPGIILLEEGVSSELENFLATITKAELASSANPKFPIEADGHYATEVDLIRFFEAIRHDFSDLSNTRFHLLFDDAGEPYVPKPVQYAINDLLISSNPYFCVKFSAEKHTFQSMTSSKKPVEPGHDYFELDISLSLFFGAGSTGIRVEDLEKYFRGIVERRLEYFDYKSRSIVEYLGDDRGAYDKLVHKLMVGERDAYYFGWHAVWSIADRTPRTLLEIVSEIFSAVGVLPETSPFVVPRRDQDRAIRTISEKRLQALSQISGLFSFGGRRRSLGRQLYDVTTTIGSAFHVHLRSQARGKPEEYKTPKQKLAIERNDIYEVSDAAGYILRKLITFGVLDATKAFVARDDGRKKAIYVLNRIYCPAFAIGYRRDDQLALSSSKFEKLLISPDIFRKGGTEFLRTASNDMSGDLFDE